MLTRQKEFLQWIIGGASTAALIAGTTWVAEREQARDAGSSSRQPASESPAPSPEKEKILKPTRPPIEASGKGGGNMTITFASTSESLVPGGLNLTATVHATIDLSDVHYEWLLPDGVTLTKGALTGDLGAVSDDEDATINASFAIPPTENKKIHLQVYRLVDGEKMGQVTQYNTLDQKTIERSMATKREILDSESERSPASEKPRIME